MKSTFSEASLRLRVLLTSLALLIPCFWHPRIEAGDLSSHIYNSWLAREIEQGKAPGLAIVPQSTNVLFDLILSELYRAFGAAAAQRVAVSAAVLIFSWGAFGFIGVLHKRLPWFLMPCISMLAYGWAFHSGLFNFYLSSGISLIALALMWNPGPIRVAAGSVLLTLAYIAHALAFAWAAGMIAYIWIARRLALQFRLLLFTAAACLLIGLRFWIVSHYQTFWSPHQVLEAVAVDQVWTFGLKYYPLSIGLALVWGFLFLRLTHLQTPTELASSIPFQLSVLTSLGVLLIPTRIELPGFNNPLFFISERMTLLLGVLICAVLGAVRPPKWQTALLAALSLVYFSYLYVDTGALNAAESRLETAVNQLRPGQRVFSSFSSTTGTERVVLWPHAVDRVCIGRCVSYNNYEPYSAAFRVRALTDNALAVRTAQEHNALAYGGYIVRDRDAPLYQVQPCGSVGESFCIRALQPGEVTRSYTISILPFLW
jgi:hypothetical protein